MRIMILGATGLIGKALIPVLAPAHQLTLVGRASTKLHNIFGDAFAQLTLDKLKPEHLAKQDILINLAGEGIAARRWDQKQKQRLVDSRVCLTAQLADYCITLGNRAPRWLNASAIGIYGWQTNHKLQMQHTYTEASEIPSDSDSFLAQVGRQWEAALVPAEQAGVLVTKMRFGVVLAKQGGALAKMLPSFKFGLGAVLGTGQQPVSWVTSDDVVAAIVFLIENPTQGSCNIVAPGVVNQREFAKTLAQVLHRPCCLTMPAAIVRLLFGEMGEELLLNGQRVESKRLHSLGFSFKHASLMQALQALTT
jgi:uncharacterized protein